MLHQAVVAERCTLSLQLQRPTSGARGTGWMSNRGRQNVASFLALDVGADWRAGAAWFQAQLVDHDVCSNWGNWVCVSGLSSGGRVNRFDVLKQSRVRSVSSPYRVLRQGCDASLLARIDRRKRTRPTASSIKAQGQDGQSRKCGADDGGLRDKGACILIENPWRF